MRHPATIVLRFYKTAARNFMDGPYCIQSGGPRNDTIGFFSNIQNKLHFAVTGMTATELRGQKGRSCMKLEFKIQLYQPSVNQLCRFAESPAFGG